MPVHDGGEGVEVLGDLFHVVDDDVTDTFELGSPTALLELLMDDDVRIAVRETSRTTCDDEGTLLVSFHRLESRHATEEP